MVLMTSSQREQPHDRPAGDPVVRLRIPRFRPGQAEIVEGRRGGRDVLAIMPTGGGKSLCFQLPALCRTA
jgi:ATP-dependent helicase YprA (DUF1998 family)